MKKMGDVKTYLSPTQKMEDGIVDTVFIAVQYDREEKNEGFIRVVKRLASLLEKYMPDEIIQEIHSLYIEVEEQFVVIGHEVSNPQARRQRRIDFAYPYAEQIFDLCVRVLFHSPIVEARVDFNVSSSLDRGELRERISQERRGEA